MSAADERIVRCRYIRGRSLTGTSQCSGEAVDPDAELLLCTEHLAAAWRMVASLRAGSLLSGGVR